MVHEQVYFFMTRLQQELDAVKLDLRWINFNTVKPEHKQHITLLDIADKLKHEKRLMLSFLDGITRNVMNQDDKTLVEAKQEDIFIHLYYKQDSVLTLEYVNDSIPIKDFYRIRKMYYSYINN